MSSPDSVSHRCPACGSAEVERVRRTRLERFLLRRRRPYRCVDCAHRFLDRPTGEAETYFAPGRKRVS